MVSFSSLPCFRSGFRPSVVVLTAALLASANAAHADYLWLQRGGDASAAPISAVARFGEIDKTPESVNALSAPRAFLADGKDLPLAAEANRFVIFSGGAANPATGADLRAVASRVSADGALHIYQAKLGRAEIKAVNDLELVPTQANGNTFKLIWKGSSVAAAQVNVDTSEGWHRVLKPAADGTITLATPFPAIYVLEVSAKVHGAATIDGKKYEDVRHTATLSFEVMR